MPTLHSSRPHPTALLAYHRLKSTLRGLFVVGFTIFSCPIDASFATERWFRVNENKWFDGWQTQLQELIDSIPDQPSSTICIVAHQDTTDEGSLLAYVIWPAQHRLITWVPSTVDEHSLVHERRTLDLNKDVVATRKDIGSSTYLADKAWVKNIKYRCKNSGTTLKLKPNNTR